MLRRLAIAVAAVVVLLPFSLDSPERGEAPIRPNGPVREDGPVVVGAAGDIACDPTTRGYNGGEGTANFCRMRATSDLLLSIEDLDAVLALGDTQYDISTLDKYRVSYDPTWGRLKAITHPVPGNHEYAVPGANDYFEYFGAAAGDPSAGYYSFDLGSWHVIALNSECWAIGGCHPGSPQEQWLRQDLAKYPARCTLAFWHRPRFSSGGSNVLYSPFWEALHESGADVILNGHGHFYERLQPLNPRGRADPELGIRPFIVGTGGTYHSPLRSILPTSEAWNMDTFGVLQMELRDGSYSWRFLPEPGKSFTDSGSASCH